MKKYHLINNITGWIVFLLSSTVYLMTVEPTASFWDCGEFIAAAYKLEVGHPPGAPFFLLLGRVFSLFASDPSQVAKMVNSLSALASAFTILFLFWTITHLARKIIKPGDHGYSVPQIIVIIGSGLVGALTYTFSDTFWFSAVEGEVYATSSLFTAVVFWAILKWENEAKEKYANRWIILIAYLMGLSVGVHLLNLLAIPAIVLVYYFRNYQATRNGVLYALLISVVLLGGIMYVLIPGILLVASWFELMFVNGFGLPFNFGLLFYIALIIALLFWGILYTIRKQKVILNTVLVGVTVFLIGYSSYAAIIIRSSANLPMDQNSPDNVFSLLSYLNREQYGDRPLVYGQPFTAPLIDQTKGKAVYAKMGDQYKLVTRRVKNVYAPEMMMLFPRMYSDEPLHQRDYRNWTNFKGTPVRLDVGGETKRFYKPTVGENLWFFIRYQLGHMYFRYFMWNFSGRQNDIQGHGEIHQGNWITGISFIDQWKVGPQDKLPDNWKNNEGRNTYYMLPLLLGLAGLFVHYKGHKNDFWVVMSLFLLTGIAIVVYLNQNPHQPRERDYAYAGSFYAFTIWIGLGVVALFELLKNTGSKHVAAILSVLLSLGLVPGIMASENWDDHDRSGRYAARDFGSNYLNSCAPNSIIFTYGDNDTFPLWYCQEVEGIRTDVRVINLSYLGGDWYISQMKRKAYESDPVPFSLTREQYVTGTRDGIFVQERIKDYVDLEQVVDFVKSDERKTKLQTRDGDSFDFIPTKKLQIRVDSAQVFRTGTLPKEKAGQMTDYIRFELKDFVLYKDDLMILDLLAHNNWERPIYFAITVPNENYLNLESYFQTEGLAYRFVPLKPARTDYGPSYMNTNAMYDNMMNKFKWGNVADENVYLDETTRRMCYNMRSNFSRLAMALIEEGKADSAKNVLDRSLEVIPSEKLPLEYNSLAVANLYFELDEKEKGIFILEGISKNYKQELEYYFSLGKKFAGSFQNDIEMGMTALSQAVRMSEAHGEKEWSEKLKADFEALLNSYATFAQ